MRKAIGVFILLFYSLVAWSQIIATTALKNIGQDDPIDPVTLNTAIWIDAEDYPVGTFANGAALTNRGNSAITFTVVGTTLAIQINADGKKEFVFDGNSVIQCQSATGDFTQYKAGTISYTAAYFGAVGSTTNPDAFYGICGNNTAVTSLSHGFSVYMDNRTAQPIKGMKHIVSKNVSGQTPINSAIDLLNVYNENHSFYWSLDLSLIIDHSKFFLDGDLVGVADRSRTTANTTSGLGTVITFSGSASSTKFEIGSVGNGSTKLVGRMQRFMLFNQRMQLADIRGVDAYFNYHTIKGDSNYKYLTSSDILASNYVLGGNYSKNADESKTIFVTSRGPNHFAVGSDREGVQVISTDDGFTWPSSYTLIWSDATRAVHAGMGGGMLPSGRLLLTYANYHATTGAYLDMTSRYSDDDGTTWSSETTITLPVTSPALTAWITCDKMELTDGGDILIPWYGISGTSLYNVYAMKSTDGGATWNHYLVTSSPTEYKNEGSIINLGGGHFLYAVRVETAVSGSFVYEFFKSTDEGETWSSLGTSSLGLTLYVYPHPPMLRKFDLDGTRVIELIFVNRGTRRLHAVYATAADVDTNGISAFTSKTLYTFDLREQGSDTGWESGYPFIIHPHNDIRSEGVWFEETAASTTNTIFFHIDNELRAKIKNELGI
jgi:hypothetical protein